MSKYLHPGFTPGFNRGSQTSFRDRSPGPKPPNGSTSNSGPIHIHYGDYAPDYINSGNLRNDRIINETPFYNNISRKNGGDKFQVKTNTAQELVEWFNIHRLPDFNTLPESYMGFVIFTRPELNLYNNESSPNPQFLKSMEYHHYLTPPYDVFTKTLTRVSNSNFLPHFTAKAKDFRVDGRTLRVNEMGETYMGQTIGYARPSYDHRKGRSIEIEFENDSLLSVYRTVAAWRDYMQLITHNHLFRPRMDHIYPSPILDYAASIYYIVTKRDARTIVFWQKYIGVFPISVPDDIFSTGINPDVVKTINVSFHCSGIVEPNIPMTLLELNKVSNRGGLGTVIATRYVDAGQDKGLTITSGPYAQARAPFIVIDKDGLYYLEWRNPRAIPEPGANNTSNVGLDPSGNLSNKSQLDNQIFNEIKKNEKEITKNESNKMNTSGGNSDTSYSASWSSKLGISGRSQNVEGSITPPTKIKTNRGNIINKEKFNEKTQVGILEDDTKVTIVDDFSKGRGSSTKHKRRSVLEKDPKKNSSIAFMQTIERMSESIQKEIAKSNMITGNARYNSRMVPAIPNKKISHMSNINYNAKKWR